MHKAYPTYVILAKSTFTCDNSLHSTKLLCNKLLHEILEIWLEYVSHKQLLQQKECHKMLETLPQFFKSLCHKTLNILLKETRLSQQWSNLSHIIDKPTPYTSTIICIPWSFANLNIKFKILVSKGIVIYLLVSCFCNIRNLPKATWSQSSEGWYQWGFAIKFERGQAGNIFYG
jgi:hypothetical protein